MKTLNTSLEQVDAHNDALPPVRRNQAPTMFVNCEMHRATVIEPDAVNAAQRQAADRQMACLADRCRSGDKPCPCPDACLLPEDDAGRSARIPEGGGLVIAVAIVGVLCAAFLLLHAAFVVAP